MDNKELLKKIALELEYQTFVNPREYDLSERANELLTEIYKVIKREDVFDE